MRSSFSPNLLTLFFVAFVGFSSTAQTPEFWGMTLWGGEDEEGTIFRTDGDGNNHQVALHVQQDSLGSPKETRLLQASNGVIYGVADTPGSWVSGGAIYTVDPITNEYTPIVYLDAVLHGMGPTGQFIQASNGNLYGVCWRGGTSDSGTLYEYNIATGTLTKLVNFNGSSMGNAPQTVFEASNGKLYGTTNSGGNYGYGVFFEYDLPTSTFTKLLDFNTNSFGLYPDGALAEANGNIYGTTGMGGNSGMGVIYEYNPVTTVCTVKHNFSGVGSGNGPRSGLISAPSGLMYGTTIGGGTNDDGVIYEYNPTTNVVTKKHDLNEVTDGRAPLGAPVQMSDGRLYGLTEFGGSAGEGTMYSFDPVTLQFTTLVNFYQIDVFSGDNPTGALMQASNGLIYGTTNATSGGATGANGTIFTYDIATTTWTKIHTFYHASEGKLPYGTLTQISSGNLFGSFSADGAFNKGTLFEYCPGSNTLIARHHFNGDNGRGQAGTLIEGSDGLLYGTTGLGGTSDLGVLFTLDPLSYQFTKLMDFDGGLTLGGKPGGMIQAANGNLYGVCFEGGVNDDGILWEYNPVTDVFVNKLDFGTLSMGEKGSTELMQASNGKLYAVMSQGGAANLGAVYEFDLATDTYTRLADLTAAIGDGPTGGLIEASNGLLYGLCNNGGGFDLGVIISFDPATNTLAQAEDFGFPSTGKWPRGKLIEASNGNLYGTTINGGTYNMGVVFEYNIGTDVITATHSFNDTLGMRSYGSLIEITDCYTPCTNGVTSSGGTQLCSAASTDISVNSIDPLAPSSYWYLYSGTCGGTLLDSNTTGTFTVSPIVTTDYFIQASGGCLSPTSCIPITIQVGDTTAPIDPLLSDVTGDCAGVTLSAPSAMDACSGAVVGTTTDPLTYSAVGLYTVNWSFDDGNGNVLSVPQNVIISDLTPPVPDLTTLPNVNAQCSVTSLVDPTATDACGGVVTVSNDAVLPITMSGTTVVTWTYDDGNGNTSTQTQNVVIDDNLAPVPGLATLPDLTAECEIASLTPPTALDNCSGSITATHTTNLPITTQGTTVVTWYYNDGNGNISSQTQNVVLNDVTAPIPSQASLPTLTDECEVAGNSTLAIDDCSGNVSGVPDVSFPISTPGTTLVTWSFDDGNGNVATQTQEVIITPIDNTVTLSDPVTLVANASGYNYQWIDCGNGNAPITGETNQTFVGTATGSYAVIIDNGTCSDTSDCVQMYVGLEENDFGSDLIVYPNPTAGDLLIELGAVYSEIVISVYTVEGKLTDRQVRMTTETIELSIAGAPGTYFVEIQADEKLARVKIVKE